MIHYVKLMSNPYAYNLCLDTIDAERFLVLACILPIFKNINRVLSHVESGQHFHTVLTFVTSLTFANEVSFVASSHDCESNNFTSL